MSIARIRAMQDALERAAAALRAGGVVAYPTEAVFGLGCDPQQFDAFRRIFELKQRLPAQGVLLIGARFEHVAPYIDLDAVPGAALSRARASWPGPHTWVFPAADGVPDWIRGEHRGIALRVIAHPPAAALCEAFGGAIVSTSANRHGQAPARTAGDVRAAFDAVLSAIIDAPVGGLERPTGIRDALTGAIIRA